MVAVLAAIAVGLGLAFVAPGQAAVYNVSLYSDSNPDYTSCEKFAASVLPPWQTPQEQAIAVWRWGVRNRRQTHATFEGGRGIWDPIAFFNNYGNTHCGYISAHQQTLTSQLGGDWRTRHLELGGHTVYEASWDAGASWHMFDASMNIYCFDEHGTVASAADIAAPFASDVSAFLGATGPVAGHHYVYQFAPECGSNPVHPDHALDPAYPWGYRRATDDPVAATRTLRNGASSFIDGYSVQDHATYIRHGWRYRLNLRRWEHYTRHWHHLGEDDRYYRPTSYGTDPDDTSPAGSIRGNGYWVFAPDLTTDQYRRVLYDASGIVHRTSGVADGALVQPAMTDSLGWLSFKVCSANVVTSATVHLAGLRQSDNDTIRLSVSRDGGRHWTSIWTANETGTIAATIDLEPDLVGGAWEYLVRAEILAREQLGSCGLDSLRIETITQLNRLALPRLQLGGNDIRLALGEQNESIMVWPELHDNGSRPQFEDQADSWTNVHAHTTADVHDRAILRPAIGGQPAHVTWRVATPTPITSVEYGGSLFAREAYLNDQVELAHSFDGDVFTTDLVFDQASAPTWNATVYPLVTDIPDDTREVWLRYAFQSPHDQSMASTGVQDALMYVHHQPRDRDQQPVAVTYCWTEHHHDGDQVRQHTQVCTQIDQVWSINVAGYRDPTMNWVRVNLEGYGPDSESETNGYHDGDDVGNDAGYERQRLGFRWQDNLAYQAAYTVDRPGWDWNPDDGDELTNGCIVPSTGYMSPAIVQEQTALWSGDEPVTVTIDLAAVRELRAVRITTHQPSDEYCHPARIEITTAVDSTEFIPVGTVQHDQVWRPNGPWLGWEAEQSLAFADLPAMGRLSYPFWLALDAPVSARWVRCRFEPLAGRGVGISEIQILSDYSRQSWPQREVWMPRLAGGDPGNPTGDGEHAAGTASGEGQTLIAAPNPFNAAVLVAWESPRAAAVSLTVYDVRGRRIRRLLQDEPMTPGRHEVTWNGRDEAGLPCASGVYFGRLEMGSGTQTVRMVVVK